ncbi:PREDICTED: LOW QUALITY PROTEIN: hemicentin-2 [Myotis brandtii]|uniref:LOW QUALITY PROTEIN: hemicentin-2 n=1 Tax=Myotis brandtii TaxID=109478 RepID=UPI000703C5C2|nr:PREDICTED: LOW QUALITY PROTEIN: hemicentin-2 [Myotis brandtii]
MSGGRVFSFLLDVGPVTLTEDPAVFQRELRELYVQGGGDCPEMSVGAIKAAVEVSYPGSFIFVFSDARAKDYHKKDELLRLLQLKQSQVVFVLTGDCGDRTHPGYLAYEEVAATSSGQVFHLDKQQVTEVLKWVESAIQASKVHLLSTDHEEQGEHTWRIPFDPSLKEVTISLSGPGPEIEVRDPLGRILQKDEGLNVLLNIPDSAKVVAFKPEHPGLWSIKVYSSGRHSVRITGISNINFRAGFSTQPSLDLNHTIEWPLQGVPISLVINSTGLQAPGRVDSVELSRSSGQPLLTLPTQLLSNGSTHQLWGGPPFHAPQERFYLKVKGEDHEGNPLLRVSGVAYSGVAPGGPLVSMPPRIHGYLHQPLLVSCSVHSALPFRLQLRRHGARLGEERHLQESGNSSWEIPRASKAEEGTYECTAVSGAGTGRAQALVIVTDPPPQLVPAPNVTVSPGETATLSCWVLGEAPHNLTWVRDWRVLPASTGRVRQLDDLSLEVSAVVPSDGGRYQCIASNANGVTRASAWLLVREAPKVSIHTRSQRFSQGVEVRVSCSASGYPAPHISWSRDGHTLQEDSRIHVDGQGTLIIQGLAPEDAGNYSCQAANEVGTDEETVTLYHTDPPSVSAVNAVVLAAVGQEAVLACEASGVPPPRLIWYREGLEMILAPEDSSSGALRIPVARERDAGVYTCRAVNELGAASAEIRLEVGRDSQPLQPGRGSRTRQPESGVLFFESVVPEDQAPYVCEAQNVFGKVQAETRLLVTGHAPPQIASAAPTVRVLERQPVSLPCIILAGRPFPERRWLKAGQPLPAGSRHSVRADGSLHLDRALQEDAGKYSCVVTNTAGSQHRHVQLVVQVPPRIRPTATHHVTNEGVPASLPCVASGVPTPTVTWTKETNALASGGPHYNVSKDGTLVIAQPSPRDAGAYVCTATNSVGFSSQEMWLSVNTKPRIHGNFSRDADEPLRVTAKAGDEVTLDCEAQGSPPPLVTWTKDSHPVPAAPDRHRLLPSGSLRLAQAQAGDSSLHSAARHYVLGVQVPPQVQPGPRVLKVLAGEAVDLNCVAEGTPEPRLNWSKDGEALRGGGPEGSVHFAAIRTSDAGMYRCEAANSAGVDAWELELRVLEPPHWGADETGGLLERVAGENASLPCPARVPPSIREDGRRANVSGMAGQALTLECDANGFPAPEITWFKDGQLIPEGDSHRLLNEARALHLPRIQAGDSGLYSCRAENAAGTAQRDFELLVLIPPSVLGAGAAQEVLGLAGAQVELECRTSGVPTPQVEWTKDRQPVLPGDPHVQLLEDGQLLRITSSHLGDEGRYQCAAVSPAGQQAKDFQLRIHSPPTIWGSNETSEVAVIEGHPARLLSRNPVGVAEKAARLEVYVPPTIEGAGEGPHLVKAVAGRPLGLECVARGYPPPTLSWHHEGLPLAEMATSPAGEAVLQYAVDVQVPPQLLVAEGLGQVTTLVGQPLEIPCQASGSPVPTIQWLQNGRPAEELVGVQVASQGTTLHIDHVEPGHAGLFSCQATNEAGTAGAEVELSVHELPSAVIVGGENITAPFLQPVTLRCAGTGVPTPSLRWWKDGVALAASGGNLQIEKVDLRDEGVYTCVATNLAGESRRDAVLKVLVPPNIEPVPANKAVLENASVTLECLASGVPPPDISWFKGRQPVSARKGVTVSADGRVLLIERARPSDAGSYRCVASNVAGRTELQYGLRVNGELPTLLWLKDGNPVSTAGTSGLQVFPGGRTLTLASARASDSGTYSCVAVSAVGEDRRDIALHVHGRPLELRPGPRLSADKALLEVDRAEVWDAGRYTCEALNQAGRSEKHYNLNVWVPPVFPSREPRILTVTEGHPARLSCECRGVPFPKITWRKDGQPVPREGAGLGQVSAVGRLLYLGPAQPAQEGTYTCECSNVAGNSSQDQQLEVHVPPQIAGPREPPAQVSVVRDAEATLECNATGKPPPRNQGQSLHVERAQAAHAGRYSCLAENVAGRAERRFALSVLVPPELIGDSDPLTNVTAALHSPLTLLCEATGIPPPGVRWFQGEEPISPGEDTYLLAGGWMLKVTRTQERDRGLYSCLASNEAGEVRRNFSVEVLVPPSIENEDLEEVVKIPEGQTANLTCNATGHPQPRVTWFKDGRPLAGGDTQHISPDGALLQVLQANLSSAGHYSCIAANAAGERTKHVQLSVLVAPSILGVTEDGADEEVTVTINNPISLICETLAFPTPTITWMKDGSPFEASNNIQLLPGTHGLQILNAQKEDAGQYTCVVTNELGEAVKNYHVEVLIPPSISKDDSMGEVGVKEVKTKVNSTLTLECECWAAPPPAISWYKDGRPVAPHERLRVLGEGRLQIQPTQVSDSGRYLCVASNVAGEDDQDFSVLIQVPPMFQKVGDASATFEILSREEEARGGVTEYREVVENNPAYLYCDTNAVPPPELTWYREDQPLSATDGVSVLQGGRVLQIPLVRAEDAGRYSCKASNEVGEDWLHYELMVLTPPVIPGDTEELVEEVTVNASSTVSLQCPALGNPMPTISWLQNGLPFSPSPRLQVLEDGQVLQVSTAEVADVASYMCVAENPAGSVEKLFTLRVQVPPHITGLDSEQVTAILNSSVSLPCDVRAHPSPEVTWYKDGQALSLGEDVFLLPGTHTLQLARAQPADSGTYMCEALNAAGRDQKLVRLSVLVPPTFRQALSGPQDGFPVRAGDKAVLSCETDSLPEPAVTWYKDGQPLVLAPRTQTLQGGQKLAILDTQVSDKGVYSCKVNNTAGEAMRTFVLTVQVPPTFENPKTETVSQVAGSPLVLTCDVTGVPAPRVTWLKDRMPVVPPTIEQGTEGAGPLVHRAGELVIPAHPPPRLRPHPQVREQLLARWPVDRRPDTSRQLGLVHLPTRGLQSGRQQHLPVEGRPESCWNMAGLGGSQASGQDGDQAFVERAVWDCQQQVVVGARTGCGPGVSVDCTPGHQEWGRGGTFALSPPFSVLSPPFLEGLRISRVQLADAGVFTCVAASPAGVADRNFTLQVHVPPVLEPAEIQNNVAVVRGSPVVLPCEAQGSPLPLVSWMKDGEPLFLQSLEQGPSLQLETAGAGDSGTYSCVAVSEAGEARRHFQLTVMDPPHIEDSGQPAELSLTPGAPLELRCDARGTPLPNITWHKDGQALNSQEDSRGTGQQLRVEAVQVGDDGLYTCLAHNPAGEIEKSFRVRVQAPPNVIGPRGPRSVVGLAPGQLVLECSVEADPAPEIEWHRDGILLQADAHTQFPEQGRFLQLQALSTADSGNYSCTARNAAGSTSVAFCAPPPEVPSIQPGPPAVNASVNQTVLLPCQAEGAPPPLMSWRKDGAPLDLGSPRLHVLPEGSLRIQPVLAQDSGHYLCLASNSAGSDRQARDLRVFGSPLEPGSPRFSNVADAGVVAGGVEGGSSWVTGQAFSVPGARSPRRPPLSRSQETQRDDRGLLPSNALLLPAPGPQDAAQFECVVSNEVGEARRRYQVTIHVPPTIADDQTDFTVTQMAPVVLTCHSSGVPAPVVSWSKAGTPLGARGSGYHVSPSGALEIGQALPVHAGRYTCTAQNSAGVARKHVALTVQASPVVKPFPSAVRALVEEEVLLPCAAWGVPRPSITWQKEGLSIPEGRDTQVLPSGQLRITHARPEDAGNYFCIAQNSAGSAVGKTRLVVQVPPVIETGLPDLATTEGSHALLPCTARGSPEPDITWEKDGQPVSGAEGKFSIQPSGQLLVRNSEPRIGWTVNDRPVTEGVSELDGGSTLQRVAVSREDSGTYVCWAENRVGRVQAVSFVHVKEAPVLQGEAFSYLVEPVGGSLRLDCVVHGDPAPDIHWIKDGLPLRGGRLRHQLQNGSLTIRRTEMGDSGRYQCLAENEMGAVEKVVVLLLQSAPVFQVEPQDVTVRSGDDVALRCQATGPSDGSLWLERVETRDTGTYECVAHNLLGSATARASLVVKGEPRGGRGNMIGVINGQELGVATLNASVQQEARSGVTTLRSSIGHIPASVGPLMRVLVVTIAPIYWALAGEHGDALNGHSLTGGSFRQESHMEFSTGELLTMTQVARGLDPDGLLLLDVAVHGVIPESLADADLRAQDFQEDYVQTGPGQLFVGSTQRFLQDSRPMSLRCNHSIQYEAARGPQPQLVQHLQASAISAAFDPAAEALRFQLTTALQAEENEGCPEGFELDSQGEFCVDVDECAWPTDLCPEGQRCVNLLGSYRCLPDCGPGFRVAADGADCEDVDECLEQSDECHYNQICENTPGGHRCSCPRGYRTQGPGLPCLDINECLQLPRTCAFRCHNLQGSYRCLCPLGHSLLPDGKACTPMERSAQNVTTVSHLGRLVPWLRPRALLPGGAYHAWVSLRPHPGTLSSMDRAWCPPGFIRQNGVCMDLDECRVRSLCQHACRNTEGSYRCLCPSGYRLLPSGKNCQDINECEEDGIECGPGQMCFNTRGSYQCVDTPCPATYRQGSSPGRLTVRAAAPRRQSLYVLLIAVSPYPY